MKTDWEGSQRLQRRELKPRLKLKLYLSRFSKILFDDKAQQQKLAETMREDLETWLGNNGAQWLEDGIDQGVYDDFITK